jgi:hypothetical protein
MATKYKKWSKAIPTGYKTYQHFPYQGHPKYAQIGIFGVKENHLATLLKSQTLIQIISSVP